MEITIALVFAWENKDLEIISIGFLMCITT